MRKWLATGWLLAFAGLACTDRTPIGARSDDPHATAPATHAAAAPAPLHVAAAPTLVSPGPPVPSSVGPVDAACSDAACTSPDIPPQQRFVVIGDYGMSGPEEARVAWRVASLKPEFVVTTGDNNYPFGAADTIDDNIGRYFSAFIAPYHGKFGPGAAENGFFPCLGNHDWDSANAAPYLDYFSLPNNERYYEVVRGAVHLFALDSDPNEPDGTDADSRQAHWLEAQLKASSAPWKLVYFHHPPYSSGPHASTIGMRWPFAEWGASIVFSGHDHTYERFEVDGFPYIVNGVGGATLYDLGEPLAGSVARYQGVHGLVLVTATSSEFVSHFLDGEGRELDQLRLHRPAQP